MTVYVTIAPLPSVTDDVLAVIDTVGCASSLVIVTVAWAVPSVAFAGFVNVTVNVSFAS